MYYIYYCCTCSGITVLTSTVYHNAKSLEDLLQSRFANLPLGLRLWREIAKGGYTHEQKFLDSNVFKVYLTYAPISVLKHLSVIP